MAGRLCQAVNTQLAKLNLQASTCTDGLNNLYLWPLVIQLGLKKKDLCFRIFFWQKYREGGFFRIVVYYMDVEIVYLVEINKAVALQYFNTTVFYY